MLITLITSIDLVSQARSSYSHFLTVPWYDLPPELKNSDISRH